MPSPDQLTSPYAGGKNVAADVASINVLEGKIRDLETRLANLENGVSRSLRGVSPGVWDALRDFDPDTEDWLSHSDWDILDAHVKSYHPKKEETPRSSSFPQAGVPTVFDQETVKRIIDKQRSR
jgi:hypothetical protein